MVYQSPQQEEWIHKRIKGLRKIANDVKIQQGELLLRALDFPELTEIRDIIDKVIKKLKGVK